MWQFSIDVGGTFTDCVAVSPNGEQRVFKTLSSARLKGQFTMVLELRANGTEAILLDPLRAHDPPDFWQGWTVDIVAGNAPGILRGTVLSSHADTGIHVRLAAPVIANELLNACYELSSDLAAPVLCIRYVLGLPKSVPLPPVSLRLGTTRGTNALLERKGARTAFVTTAGFGDILHIGSQERPRLFELSIQKPQPLAARSIEIEERLDARGGVIKAPDEIRIAAQLQELREAGFESIAICLVHAYRNPAHELIVERLAREAGFPHVSRSSSVAPLIKLVPRAETTVLDAYLTPVLKDYLREIRRQLGPEGGFKLMTSSGGVIDAEAFSGKDSILSGPAGGVIGYARIADAANISQAIGFDMGGTSTDVSRYAGELELQTETHQAGVRIMTPTLAIETVAAGGGSVCQFDGVQLRVGPESAGAVPGPACYGRGGPLTVTDLNVALGRLLPDRFPFPLDATAVWLRLEAMCAEIQQSPWGADYTPLRLAEGLMDIANETMIRAIRRISTQRGFDPAEHVLIAFGGSGGVHACALAKRLGISRILIHSLAGLLSASGIGCADLQRQFEFSVLAPLEDDTLLRLRAQLPTIEEQLSNELLHEGLAANNLQSPRRILNLRYRGIESTLPVDWCSDDAAMLRESYEARYRECYGYHHAKRNLEIVSVRVKQCGGAVRETNAEISVLRHQPQSRENVWAWFDGVQHQTAVYQRADLRPGAWLRGPAIVCDETSTIVVDPLFQGVVNGRNELELTLQSDVPSTSNAVDDADVAGVTADPVLLELFNNQFASIAEQMGMTLQRTAVSTNVKERLDYSCAVFDAVGRLVVNAPHIPVHLGAMSETVSGVIADNAELHPGDVYVTNDPYRGGSHLPDVTVVTPVHHPESAELLFFTASRAHHAEIGGIAPGSMPPFSSSLAEEGVLLRNLKLISGDGSLPSGWQQVEEQLRGGPYPSRNIADNLADLAAQVAANRKGAELLLHLIASPPGGAGPNGALKVQRYMRHIQRAAQVKTELALGRLLEKRAPDAALLTLGFCDQLDEGTPIQVVIRIRRTTTSTVDKKTAHTQKTPYTVRAEIDFSGTGPVSKGNLNANRAIVTAAVMYVFRCLIEDQIPLNSGVLDPLTIILPEGLLNPPAFAEPELCAAMVGGNVETSQRVVDVLLGALGIAAASQGTMNNLTFGNTTFGYYETICGGSGATPDSPGASAVHTHMTNTRLTDVEIIEHRYPVRILQFRIRPGSGGTGQHRGGDGVIREFEFLAPLSLSLLTQRRTIPPYGVQGGASGMAGRNLFLPRNATAWQDVGGSHRSEVNPGDRLRLETPGGGGWGTAHGSSTSEDHRPVF